ncbi:hypothetical protein [Vibrio harveyi]|uniref:hypothetical protein n=1 Tax=Vibrio harveyi TaxID=669 RepID=UPI0018F1CA59|nr:hypothetical protein [Vibrio harveyi]
MDSFQYLTKLGNYVSTKLKHLNEVIEELIDACHNLSWPDDHLSNSWGWNFPTIRKSDMVNFFFNFKQRLEVYENTEPDVSQDIIDAHVESLQRLLSTIRNYVSNSNNFHQVIGSLYASMYLVFSDLEYELFSLSRLKKVGLLPKSLVKRCESYEALLTELEARGGNLAEKVKEINSAYDVAESLPADIDYLKKARETISKEHDNALSKVQSVLAEVKLAAVEVEKQKEDVNRYLEFIRGKSNEAQELIKKCDDAFQVTTTQGIAAGFDQKAKELKNSIWVYIIGLIIALVSGAALGYIRVESFNEVLSKELTAGQAIIHTLMSLFSIGGPLWLAWICTQQINQRFKLSEDYSYKATVSKSFMGFSKLASRFDKSTEERLFNSTLDRLEEMPLRLIEGKDYNSPWHEFVDSDAFRTAVKSFPQLASEAMRFAKNTKLKKGAVEPKLNDPRVRDSGYQNTEIATNTEKNH